MSKLTDKQRDILQLVLRSKVGEDGWYAVSKAIWPLVDAALPDDLAETRPTENGGYIRLTERGRAVADYL